MQYIAVVVLVLMSGLFSGLTLGLFSLNLTAVERKSRLGDPRALKILPVRKDGNLLLCTLLLGNVAVNAAIAILLESIAGGVIAGFVATGLIVVFGEILPQAAFARHALDVGSKTVWLVKLFRIVLFPVTWPLARGLDWLLGEELPTIWSKREIKEIIKLHEDSPISAIDADKERIVLGALSFSDRRAVEIMTPRAQAFMLEASQKLTKGTLQKVRASGFTRIPVFARDQNNVVGILLVKDLVGRNVSGRTARSAARKLIPEVTDDMHLDRLLRSFRKQRAHLAIVRDRHGTVVGVVTLEDVIEEIMRMNIWDESDTPPSSQKKRRHWPKVPAKKARREGQ